MTSESCIDKIVNIRYHPLVTESSPIPEFTDKGMHPPGDYAVTIESLRTSPLVIGPEEPDAMTTWDQQWRAHLVDQLEAMTRQLWQVGITDIFINGSFVEDKAHPNDIDGYFVCELMRLATGELQRELNRLETDKIWTWDPASRRPYRGYPKLQLPMWHKYRVELYPHYGQPSGIADEYGHQLEFPSAFRKSRRNNDPKGIIKILKDAS